MSNAVVQGEPVRGVPVQGMPVQGIELTVQGTQISPHDALRTDSVRRKRAMQLKLGLRCSSTVSGLMCVFMLIAMLSAVCLPIVGLQAKKEVDALNLDLDFSTFGPVTVVALWHRGTVRRVTCGHYCAIDVCYDDWIAEFAWTSGPESGPFPSVDGAQLSSWRGGKGVFRRFTGSLSLSLNNFSSSAVSQGLAIPYCYSSCRGRSCSTSKQLEFHGVLHCSSTDETAGAGNGDEENLLSSSASGACGLPNNSSRVVAAYKRLNITVGSQHAGRLPWIHAVGSQHACGRLQRSSD